MVVVRTVFVCGAGCTGAGCTWVAWIGGVWVGLFSISSCQRVGAKSTQGRESSHHPKPVDRHEAIGSTASMSEEPAKLRNRPCIVTGGGSGIGRAIAVGLARAGAEVAITGRREESLEETAAVIAAQGGVVHTCPMDVTDAESVATGMARLAESMELDGRLHALVNNAGQGGPNACAVDGPDRWDTVIRTNLDGIYFCTREAVKHRHAPAGAR